MVMTVEMFIALMGLMIGAFGLGFMLGQHSNNAKK